MCQCFGHNSKQMAITIHLTWKGWQSMVCCSFHSVGWLIWQNVFLHKSQSAMEYQRLDKTEQKAKQKRQKKKTKKKRLSSAVSIHIIPYHTDNSANRVTRMMKWCKDAVSKYNPGLKTLGELWILFDSLILNHPFKVWNTALLGQNPKTDSFISERKILPLAVLVGFLAYFGIAAKFYFRI